MQEPSADSKEWKPQPFAERRSQNLTFFDYAKERIIGMVIGAGAGTFLGSQLGKIMGYQGMGRQNISLFGGMLGTFITDFRHWRKVEATQLSIKEIYSNYKDIPGLRPSNEELAADNAALRQMIAFNDSAPHPKHHIAQDGLEHQGKLAHEIKELMHS